MCFGPSVNPAAGAAYGGAAGMLGGSPAGASQNYQPFSFGGGPFGFGGFAGSPWLPFLMNYLSGYGIPQRSTPTPAQQSPAQRATAPSPALSPSQPDIALPPPAPVGGVVQGTDPAASMPQAPQPQPPGQPYAPPLSRPLSSPWSNLITGTMVTPPGSFGGGYIGPWAGMF
jgi:hypothetical protein